MNRTVNTIFAAIACILLLTGCQPAGLYEKTAVIPRHSWNRSFKPAFTFTINDTSSAYQLYLTLRHRDQYNYNNIYIKISTRQPGEDNTQSAMYDLKLGDDETGWLGSGMDDIYEHRIPLTPAGTPFYFRKKGTYTFTIEHAMREDPLKNVMNAGLRIEKK